MAPPARIWDCYLDATRSLGTKRSIPDTAEAASSLPGPPTSMRVS